MANEIRRRVDFAAGGLTSGLAPGATTMTSDGLQDLPALASDEYFPLSLYRLDSAGRVTQKEIVYMTAHSAAAGSGTIVRAREGTTAQTWNAGDRWSLTDLAIDNLFLCKTTTRPSTPFEGLEIYDRTTGRYHWWNGSNWIQRENLRMSNVGAALVGSAPAIDTGSVPFKMQAGTIVFTSDGSGMFTLVFPTAFPNGLLMAMAVPGSTGAGDWRIQVNDGGFSASQVQLKTHPPGILVRAHWLAIGW